MTELKLLQKILLAMLMNTMAVMLLRPNEKGRMAIRTNNIMYLTNMTSASSILRSGMRACKSFRLCCGGEAQG